MPQVRRYEPPIGARIARFFARHYAPARLAGVMLNLIPQCPIETGRVSRGSL